MRLPHHPGGEPGAGGELHRHQQVLGDLPSAGDMVILIP